MTEFRSKAHSFSLLSWLLAAGGLAGAGCGGSPPEGVLLIVVDALRADHLGVYGYPRATSPQIDDWAKEGLVFERAFATSPWTLPALGSLLTGRIPSRHSAGSLIRESDGESARPLDRSLPTIAELLSRADFATGAIINNPFLKPQFGVARGFRSFDYKYTTNWRHRRADEVLRASLAWIAAQGHKRFLLLVHIFDPHLAYDPPPPVRGRFTSGFPARLRLPVEKLNDIRARAPILTAEERAFITAAYDEEIAFVDQQVGRFFEELRNRGWWERLLVILTSDHGEELFDHGGFEHGHTLYQELLRVPLLVWGPGVEPGREAGAVSVVDLAPTILDATGIGLPQEFEGISLWPSLTGDGDVPPRFLVAEGILSGPERKAIIQWPLKLEYEVAGGRRRLYDLASDPGERVDLSLAQLADANRLGDELRKILQEASKAAGQGEGLPLDPETLKEIRSLGYVR